ncbi:hypothetical protein [Pedobacter sp. GR22-6]|uniref:hypothetical protein n=1 Tax=Pedobacter sp. GR22-6 TaxID=3127957 RepID=UPI00307F940B
MIKPFHTPFFICLVLLVTSCGTEGNKKQLSGSKQTATESEEDKPKERLKFDDIIGIRYTEVKRRFSNNLSFNELGFQQEPSWIIEFQSQDTVLAYSPVKERMLPFFLMYDHGDVYNFAKEFFRIKKISKDSLVFQRLHVEKKKIASDIKSDVNMTFYANSYIEKVLKTTAAQLQRPTRADTAYIQDLTNKANQEPGSANKAFAGRQPVKFTSTSPLLSVMKKSTVDKMNGRTEAFDYLFPKYRIVISKAYKDFAFEFKVVVDAQGKMHLTNVGYTGLTEPEAREKTIKAVIDVYLRNLMKTEPGTTLGIVHPSEITLVVVGRKSGTKASQ